MNKTIVSAGPSGYATVDFFTGDYRVSAQINVRNRTVNDILNDKRLSYLEVFDAYISRISQPGYIVGSHHVALLRKENISFSIVPTDESRPSGQRAYRYGGKLMYEVFLTLPAFEVQGKVHTTGKLDLHAFLVTNVDDFVILTEPMARVANFPDNTFSGESFLVNRLLVTMFCASEHPERVA
ncbi:MAG: hypothetical protein SVX38_11685 [Chloroflexota bacterium]|nr:hypothetical protein [Chloroflexota bacterium]